MFVLSKSSGTGSTRWTHTITFVPEPDTYASALLLREELRQQDEDFMLTMESVNGNIAFSRQTLQSWQDRLGSLFCVYCMGADLEIEFEEVRDRLAKTRMATLEHLQPLSQGGSRFSPTNVVCACKRCNNNRGRKSLDSYLHSLGLDHGEFTKRCRKYFDLSPELV